ncbi:G-I-Y Y-I-G endonuclease [Mycobacterium phage Heath]|uniref:G-I-Y Y-I-G endonuclease n=1 Tax=Mycobacterium phage Heath TaxID=2762421 RepID=A0A7G8LFW6_9CAUD|nr:G-I-Y Y-I-G endonuclease [Mycobacterium phage Heath]QNJ56138.1 G-I-Y Y-I-G endonuclease [Mycobacterium phage Heath]
MPRRAGMQVYFIADELGHVKIGTSKAPLARLEELQAGNPTRLRLVQSFPGGHDVELELHRHYATYRMHGEWFKIPDDQLITH